MKAIIPSVSIKGFQATLACLAKIGDDVVIEARPEGLVLSTINITRSAFANFSFHRSFFESYRLDVNAPAIQHDAKGPYLRCKVLAKALVSACKIRGKVEEKIEKCCIFMDSAEGVGENCRLTIEIIFKFGFIKIHKLLYEACPDNLQVIYSKQSCPSSWRLPTQVLVGFMDNFSSKAEEITMKCNEEVVIFDTATAVAGDESGAAKKFGTTSVPINRGAMEYYRLQGDIDMTFSMKEFKAIIAFALSLRIPLEGYFDARCRPILLSVVAENVMTATFALATIVNSTEYDENGPGTQQPRAQTRDEVHGELDLTQPENALFLDDDADFEEALGDFDMEEEALTNQDKHRPAEAVPVNNVVQDGSMDVDVQGDGYLIEEEDFLPLTQRATKKARLVAFDDDEDF